MVSRRSFIRQASLTAALFSFPTADIWASKIKRVGIQLYSLRDIIHQDTLNVLKNLAKFGYKELEAYNIDSGKFHGYSGKEFKKITQDLGMKVTGAHAMSGRIQGKPISTNLDDFAPSWKKTVEIANEAGLKYLTIPWTHEHFRKTLDDVKQTIEELNVLAEYTIKQGLKFAYHNHDFEFKLYDGISMYDRMLKDCNVQNISFEMDLYWVVYAGQDPLTYFKNHSGRFHQFHIKDLNPNNPKENTDLGKGKMNFVQILQNASQAGCKHFYVEQETGYNPNSLTSAQNNALYLKKLNF